jgi:ribokinase
MPTISIDSDGQSTGEIDVAVAVPAFIDMTFVGLEAIPRPGEERFAGDLVRSPGGGAITAIGSARLGLRTALASPLGEDAAGELIRRALAQEGVRTVERHCPRTPVTMVLPLDGDRAMVTYDSGIRAQASDLAALAPRAVVAGLDQLALVPDGADAYVTCGDDDARAFAGRLPARLGRARAFFANRREAMVLTGAATPEEAAARLGEHVESAVVTLGPEGAVAIVDGRPLRVPGIGAHPLVDPTGAGDLLAAAWVWGDVGGLDPEARLSWAVLYAGLSVTVPTGAAGAVPLERFLAEGAKRGLPGPPALNAGVA